MRLAKVVLFAACLGASAPANADIDLKLDGELGAALRQLFDEMKPHLDEALEMLQGFEALDGVADPRHYTLPEVLPNGDIIIRRRDDAPPFQPMPQTDPPATEKDEIVDL